VTQDGLITLVALVIAGLGFLPAVRRLHLRATLRRGLAVTVPAFIAVLYFEFYGAAQLPCPSPLGNACRYLAMGKESPFGPRDAAFAIVIAWAAALWVAYQRNTISAASLHSLKSIVAELIQIRDYSTLVDLLEPNLDLITSAAARDLRRQRWYDWWAARRARAAPRPEIILFGGKVDTPTWRRRITALKSWGRRTTGWPGLALPSGSNFEAEAGWIRERLLTDVEFRRYLVQQRPGFGARLMVAPGHLTGDFATLFLADLATDTESSLYREIERSGGASHWRSRGFDDSYPLLSALLNDASVADRMSAWQPIAEYFISRIQPGNDAAYVASLNRRGDRLWDERGRHHDTAFATITFFDLMVTAAAFQGVKSDMWLMYADHFTRALLAIHDESGPEIDRSAEWPTRGSEMLYRIVAALTDWIGLIQRLPKESFHLQLTKPTLDEGEGRIPKSALISLVRVTQAILLARAVSDDFKDYIFAIALRCVTTLPVKGEDVVFRQLLVSGLAGAGSDGRRDAYVVRAWQSFRSADHVLQMKAPDLKSALQAAQPISRPAPAQTESREPKTQPKSLWQKLRGLL
jgi:hypothetical protein